MNIDNAEEVNGFVNDTFVECFIRRLLRKSVFNIHRVPILEYFEQLHKLKKILILYFGIMGLFNLFEFEFGM